MIRATRPANGYRTTAIALEVLLGVGALAGGGALMLGPRGEILPLEVAWLAGSPFETYFVPGFILFTALGVGPLVVALLAWRGQRFAPLLTVGVGLALLIWLTVQFAIIGFTTDPPLQPIYLVLGAAIALVGAGWWRRTVIERRRRPPSGAALVPSQGASAEIR